MNRETPGLAETVKLPDTDLWQTLAFVQGVGYCLTYPMPHRALFSFKMPGTGPILDMMNAGFIHTVPVFKTPFYHYAMDLPGIASGNGRSSGISLDKENWTLMEESVGYEILAGEGQRVGRLKLDEFSAEFAMYAMNADFIHDYGFVWVIAKDYITNPVEDAGCSQKEWLETLALFALKHQIMPAITAGLAKNQP